MDNNKKKILITGGAGYIGSHTVKLFQESDLDVIVLDDLSSGHAASVSCPLIVGNLSDRNLLEKIFSDFEIDAVIHFSGFLIVAESVLFPDKYFENNVTNSLNLLNVMVKHGVKKIIDSSSAAVYGDPHYVPIDEDHPRKPVNPYGESKLIFEKTLKWYGEAFGISSVSLRYFNAAGASLDASIGENHPVETHLIPKILSVASRMEDSLKIFGNDYPTSDGTCVRDYIHVVDLGQAHLLSLKKLESESGVFAYNVGTGLGHTIHEVVNTAMEVSGKMIPIQYGPRRQGDPAILVADPSKIKSELSFEPKYSDLRTIISTAWEWQKKMALELRNKEQNKTLHSL